MNISPVRARLHFIRSLSAVTLATFIALALAAGLILILDRWQPTVAQANGEIVQFEFAAYTIAEADGTATITTTLSSDPGVTVTVDYATSDNTATAGSDYIATSGTLTFTTGVLTQTFTVSVTDDALDETDEAITLTLSNEAGASLGAQNPVALTITDNDSPPTVNFTAATQSHPEDVGTMTVTAELTATSGLDAIIPFVGSGSATGGTDYSITPSPILISAGSLSATVLITVTDDSPYENPETVVVSMTTPTGANLGAIALHTATITDNDSPPTLSIGNATVLEEDSGTTDAVFTVTLSGATELTATVAYTTTDNTATAPGDYLAATGTLTFTPGVLTQPITVTLNGDTTFENDETFTVTLGSPTNATITADTGTGTLTNDDSAPTLSINSVSVLEGDSGTTDAVFTVTLSGDTELTTTVLYTTTDNTATAPGDYLAATGTLTFTPGVLTQPITVTLNGDTTFENDETFTVTLGSPTNAAITADTGTGTLTNDDSAPTLSIDNVSVAEGNAGTTDAVFTVTLSGDTEVTATVAYTTTDDTATAPGDYLAATGTLTLAPGVHTELITVTVNADTIFEFNETFRVALGGETNATVIGTNPVTGTILDDDSAPSIQLIADTFSVNENAGPAVITATLTGQSEITATVNYSTTNGTAAGESDYTPGASAVIFSPGTTTMTFTVSITDDTTYEADETFTVTLSGEISATLGSPASAVVTIVNDDPPPTVSYTPDPQIEFLVLEGGGSALITVTLSNPSAYTVTVPYSTTNSTATAPGDYLSTSGTLTFTPGVITQTFPVSIVDNLFDGPDKIVNLNLGAAVSATVGGDNPETLLIVDDDGPPQVYFSAPTFSVNEDAGPAVVQVSLSSPSDLTVTVAVTATDGTASLLTDYDQPLTTTVTIAGGQLLTSATFTVPITNDVIYEGPETVNLALGVPVNAVSTGFNQTAVLTIADNETQPIVKLSASSYTVNETAPSATITATLSGQSAFTATVNLATSNGTGVGQATAGADYTAVNTTLTFSPGVITLTFPITLTNDTFFEGNEVLTATLGSPISNTTLGAPSTATVTIVDGESPPALALSASTYSVEEYGGLAVVTASLALIAPTTATEVTATVNYVTTNGTATSAGDYASRTGVLTFPPGTLTLTLTVPITNDTTYEGNETFNIALGTPVSSTLVSPSSAVITIFDDDPRPGCTIFNQTESPPLTITDDKPAGVDSTIVLSSPGVVITDVSVRIDRLWHPYVSDLRITLIPPTGPNVALVADPGVGADQDNFFHTIFLGSASTPIGSGAAPYTGNFRPDDPLSTLNGVASGGTWRLHLVDASAGDVGTLEAWGLEICGGATAPTSHLYLPLVLR